MSEDCCALNADGTLKDASEITFFNDPDDKVPLPQVASSAQPSSSTTSAKDTFSILLKAGCTPATVAAGSRRSGWPSKPSARIRDADNACGLSSSTNRRGSSVPSEHAFSSAGITSTLRRNALASSTFSALQLMKAAYKNGHVSAAVEAEGYAVGMQLD
ncbi:uncharacterized protein F5147DRAFT_784180 [Suillus discolor]|uniref:Uncharacterized protein n=1 Tax=Suillus discolor TaxID=1912936 RepID=A0A9P7EPZ6_9AGAM|nr:uncharacterized protein F5147DRAFT_784180 [Suillus discolor]KAG2080597.1 hypothetical protein F5147DRAFT_784180 [Suillus discolor]